MVGLLTAPSIAGGGLPSVSSTAVSSATQNLSNNFSTGDFVTGGGGKASGTNIIMLTAVIAAGVLVGGLFFGKR